MLPKSIRARLTAMFSLCLVIVMVVGICGLIWYARRSAERNADSLLIAAAKRSAAEMTDPNEPYGPVGLIAEERTELRDSNLAMAIIARDGHPIAKSQPDAPIHSINSNNWRVTRVVLRNGNSIIIGMPWAKTREALRYHDITLGFLGVFAIIVASVGAWVLVGRTLTPISALARQARVSSTDNLYLNLAPPSQDYEMVELVATLNGLLRRITEATAAKGRFYSAASHELRTPLQALSGHLELALSRDRTTDEYKAVVKEAYTQAKRLISLSRSLLLLYQLDSSTEMPTQEPVDIVAVCRRSLSNLQPIIKERQLDVSVQTPAEAEILAPPNHIEMLVRNLLENAVKYATSSGQVELRISLNPGIVRLEIINSCSEAPKCTPEDLIEPFSRSDKSRNSQTGGTGLGLAICKAIVDADGWQMDIGWNEEVFHVMLIISD